MATNALHALWVEPRPTNAPDPGPRDWALVAVFLCWSLVELVVRHDLAPRPLLLLDALAVLGSLPWRRTHPLVAVAVSFGTLTIVDIVRILTGSQRPAEQHIRGADPGLRPVPVGLRSGSRKRPRPHPALAAHHHRRRPHEPVGHGRVVRVLPVRRRARRRDPLSGEVPDPRHRPGQGPRTRTARS